MKRLSHGSTTGLLLTVLGIIFFALLWVMLGQGGMDNFPRLVLSFCLPPAVISLMIGAYLLIARTRV